MFDLEEQAFVEICSYGMGGLKDIGFQTSLRRLTLHYEEDEFEPDLHRAENSHGLQELNISFRGCNILDHAELIIQM